MIAREQIEEWKRLVEKVPPGPWTPTFVNATDPHTDEPNLKAKPRVGVRAGPDDVIVTPGGITGVRDAQRAKSEFIAAARTAVPALIAEVESLHALLREVEWADEAWDTMIPGHGPRACLICGGVQVDKGHEPDCRLAAALK